MPNPIIIKVPKKSSRNVKSEAEEQADFVAWFRKNYPDELIVSSLNGACLRGNETERAKQWRSLVNQGAVKGMPDLMIPFWHIVIEFKRSDQRKSKDGGLRKEQIDMLYMFKERGWDSIVCYGAKEAKDFINAFIRRM